MEKVFEEKQMLISIPIEYFSKGINPVSLIVYAYILKNSFKNICIKTNQEIADSLSISISTVKRSLSVLYEFNYIDIKGKNTINRSIKCIKEL